MGSRVLPGLIILLSGLFIVCAEDPLIADMTCRADVASDGISRDWIGEFFPNISHIKYEEYLLQKGPNISDLGSSLIIRNGIGTRTAAENTEPKWLEHLERSGHCF